MAHAVIRAMLAALVALAVAGPAEAQAPAAAQDRVAALAPAFPEIDRAFTDYARAAHVPGMAWGVIVDGRLVHTGTFGVQDVTTQAPVTADTVFRIASMTKSFTAAAILMLRDEGKLALDDPAERYVPELKGLAYPTTDSPRLTVRHLLTHAAGFPEDNPWGDQQLALTDAQMDALMRQGIPFSTPPGLAYEYSNYGFAILGRIVTNVSGMPYRDYVRTRLLAPLGLTATTLDAPVVPAARLAHGYRWEDERWKEEPPLPDGAFGAMGGMLTSLRDLAAYVAWHMDAWPARDGAEAGPLRRSSRREMQQVWRPAPAVVRSTPAGPSLSSGGYGYGLRVSQTCAFGHVVAHSGGLPGFGSQMRWLPEYGVGLVAMGSLTYTAWSPRFDNALDALARTGALAPRPVVPLPALVGLRADVTRLIQKWDDGLADSIAANNLYLDVAKDRRRAEIAALTARHGACRADGPFLVENALRGEWVMPCERGALRVAITLAPIVPPKVQFLSVRSADTADPPKPPATCQ
ncbi:penicillin-binding protein [Luteitalea sp. TBR-22]|uniref:serine hydrolase domain-containing protein n=1 Tax=Luteitalea sp. TBR-22 TaxID=2802971 RepID=UPI001AFB301D|nr:serine hydrolase domain-containing protein [Luteitalea sp. TBR-22]BCS34508.1 penicillin-binding protein [Luteitalea sp. TBR-22]